MLGSHERARGLQCEITVQTCPVLQVHSVLCSQAQRKRHSAVLVLLRAPKGWFSSSKHEVFIQRMQFVPGQTVPWQSKS